MYGIKRSFDIIKKNHSLRRKVNDHIYLFRRLINQKNLLVDSIPPIQPLVIGDDKKVIKISNLLIELGFYVPAIRPPTVPKESARLRVSISALHSKGDIKKLAQAINKIVENDPKLSTFANQILSITVGYYIEKTRKKTQGAYFLKAFLWENASTNEQTSEEKR